VGVKTATPAPGPSAGAAFRLGVAAAAVAGLGVVGFCYWFGLLDPVALGYLLVLVFPLYLVFAASALSVWLGYDKDATDLRPVSRERS